MSLLAQPKREPETIFTRFKVGEFYRCRGYGEWFRILSRTGNTVQLVELSKNNMEDMQLKVTTKEVETEVLRGARYGDAEVLEKIYMYSIPFDDDKELHKIYLRAREAVLPSYYSAAAAFTNDLVKN